jgi:uncharacterized membrane protein YczE
VWQVPAIPRATRATVRRLVRLVIGCITLGAGVGLALTAGLGSDGYSTVTFGLAHTAGVPYAFANWTLGLCLVLAAWSRGVRPGVATAVHPVVVGSTVTLVLHWTAQPAHLVVRLLLLGAGLIVMSVGVAGYLGAGLGAGPMEGAALAQRPVPFRVAYTLLQAVGTGVGRLLGAPVGLGTVVIVFGVGPIVDLIRTRAAGPRVQDHPRGP